VSLITKPQVVEYRKLYMGASSRKAGCALGLLSIFNSNWLVQI